MIEEKIKTIPVEFIDYNADKFVRLIKSDYKLSDHKKELYAKAFDLLINLVDTHVDLIEAINGREETEEEKELRMLRYAVDKSSKLELISLITQM